MPGTSAYSDLAEQLATQLKNQISGLQAYAYPPASVGGEFPVAVVQPADPLDYEQAFGGNTFRATFRVLVLVASADEATGFLSLYDMLDPTAASPAGSIRRAVAADRTLGGKCDDAVCVRAENIGRREVGGGFYYGADFIVEAIRTQ